jgi:head-tail adaptor
MYAFGRKNPISQTRPEKWIAPRLKFRVQILEPSQENNSSGGLNRSYTKLDTIWSGFEPLSPNARQRLSSVEAFGNASHRFIFRYSAISDIGKSFSSGFAIGFDSIANISPLDRSFYLFVEKESNVKGRLFKILTMMNNKANDEYVEIICEEIEEHGTGANYPSNMVS